MFNKSARYYDALYSFKNYDEATHKLHSLVRQERPDAHSLLDVACGTGRHLASLQKYFSPIEGLDINPDLLAIARERLPGVPFHEADMTKFSLGRRFDIVTCLFSSIAYVKTVEALRDALSAMAKHLNRGGLLLVEPWFTPETYWAGHLVANTVDEPELKISWMYVSELRGQLSVLDIHYQVGAPEGIMQFREAHELGLFTIDDYMEGIRATGLEPTHDKDGFFGRGLFVGKAAT